jgi:hypothetical protein
MENNEAKYDETLISLLVEHGFTPKNIANLIPVTRVFYTKAQNIPTAIKNIKEILKGGCIFKLSSGRRNSMFFLYHTTASADEVRRRLELKVFL